MRISRRSLLGALLLPAAPSLLGAPAVVGAEITPQQFGARGGDPVADTLGWNRAIAAAAEARRPVLATGTYVLRVPAASRWNWWRRPGASVHVAVALRSGVQVQGRDATILVGAPERPPADRDERHFLFGTDSQNIAPGTLRDISFEGLTFDFRDEFTRLHPYTYAFGITGVSGFRRRNITFRSSGQQAGRGLLSENTVGRDDSDLRHSNIIQGIYTRYERDVAMRRISFDIFNEALDFDGPCWNVLLEDLQFRDGRGNEAQCIDTGGGEHWVIRRVRAERTGPILFLYAKPNAWPTYESWLGSNNEWTENYVGARDWAVSEIVGIEAGSRGRKRGKAEAIRVGSLFRPKRDIVPAKVPTDIRLSDIDLRGGGQVAVHACEGLALRKLRMQDTISVDDDIEGAALMLWAPPRADAGRLSGVVQDVVIRNSQGMGVYAQAGEQLQLEDVRVEGYGRGGQSRNRAGVRVRPVAGQGTPRVGRVQIDGSPGGGRDLDR